MANWLKFSINFATLDGDDPNELLDRLTDVCIGVVDPACAELGNLDGKEPPEGHTCTRDWTAGATTLPEIPDDELTDSQFDAMFDQVEAASCPFCGRPLPDPTHEVPRLIIDVRR